MKKLAVSLLAASVLVGCGGEDNSSSSVVHPTRDVLVSYGGIELKEDPSMNVQGFMLSSTSDSNDYFHQYVSNGYTALIDDYNGSRFQEGIDITTSTSLSVKGDADVRVYYKDWRDDFGTVTDAFTYDGETFLTEGVEHTTITMTNTEWSYITLDYDENIADVPKLYDYRGNNYESMTLANGYWYAYSNISNNVKFFIQLHNGGDIHFEKSNLEANKHYAFYLNESGVPGENGIGFDLQMKWEEPLPIKIGN